jgi:hypothetical protein
MIVARAQVAQVNIVSARETYAAVNVASGAKI